MSELVSAYPTAGGIYWWAAKHGQADPRLVHRLAQPHRPDRGHRLGRLRLRDLPQHHPRPRSSTAGRRRLRQRVRPLRGHPGAARADQHLRPPASRRLQNVSVWWHVFGAAVVVADPGLRAGQRTRASSFVFTETINNSGFYGDIGGYVLVLRAAAGLPAHPVHDHRVRRLRARVGGDPGASRPPPGGSGSRSSTRRSAAGSCCWRSCSRPPTSSGQRRRAASSAPSSTAALTPASAKAVIIISTIGQFFCGMSCVTSMSRMTYAFSRDGPSPAGDCGRRSTATAPRSTRSSAAALAALVLTLPALYESPGRHPGRLLRGRLGRGHRPLPGLPHPDLPAAADGRPVPARARGRSAASTSACAGSRSIEIVIISVYFIMPLVPAGVPCNDDFTWYRRQLRADRRRRGAAGGRRLVVRFGPALVHRPAPYRRGTR